MILLHFVLHKVFVEILVVVVRDPYRSLHPDIDELSEVCKSGDLATLPFHLLLHDRFPSLGDLPSLLKVIREELSILCLLCYGGQVHGWVGEGLFS